MSEIFWMVYIMRLVRNICVGWYIKEEINWFIFKLIYIFIIYFYFNLSYGGGKGGNISEKLMII